MNTKTLIAIFYSLGNAMFLAFLLAFSQGLLKWIANQKIDNYFHLLMQHWFTLGSAISIYLFLFFYYIYVLRGVNLGVFYAAYTGLAIVFVFVMGISFFGESVNTLQILGCLLIVSGVFLVSM